MSVQDATKRVFQCRTFRICRVGFRWCRMLVWVIVLAGLFSILYVHHYGLPGPLKLRLQKKLAAQGAGLDYTRLRWRWYRGCVVEGLIFTRTNASSIWRCTAREATLDLEVSDLLRQRLKLRSCIVDHATLTWLSRTNSSRLILRNISTEFHLASHDRLVMGGGQAEFEGVALNLSGTLTNFSALPQILARANKRPQDLETTMQQTAVWARRVQAGGRAKAQLIFAGDAKDLEDAKGRLTWIFPDLQTPWGRGSRVRGMLDFNHVYSPAGRHRSELRLDLAEAQTKWASLTNLNLTTQFNPVSRGSLIIESRVALRLGVLDADSSHAENLDLNLRLTQPLTNGLPLDVNGKVAGRRLESRWGRTESLQALLHITRRNAFEPQADASWGEWARLEPWLVQFDGDLIGLETPKVKIDSASLKADWSAPKLTLNRVEARLYGGGAKLAGAVDVASRETSARGSFDFDVKSINHLLPPGTQKWLAQFEWETPPSVEGAVQLRLPAWSNKSPVWKEEVMPTVKLTGEARGGAGRFRGIPATGVIASFAFTTNTWDLAKVHATRPEGVVDFSYHGNVLDHEYRFAGSGAIDPQAILPVVPAKFQPVFKLFSLNSPPFVSGEVTGNWHDRQLFQVRGDVTATNFVFKGAAVDSFHSSVYWTNRWVQLFRPAARDRGREMTADLVEADFSAFRIALTNLRSNLDPVAVAALISTNFVDHLQPFQFIVPPDITLNGTVFPREPDNHDLHWEIAAPGVMWRKFETGPFSGRVIWTNRTLVFTNFVASPASGPGALAGHGIFHYTPGRGADFSLDTTLTDLDLHSLIARITPHTNHLEGTLGAHLVITSGHTTRMDEWEGYGDVHLRDGFIWEFPVFGIMSPVLDAIVPGLGKTRANEASADFLISHSMVSSKDLVIRAPTLLLVYHGKVDFNGNVEAIVEAQLLRDTWLLGPILRVVLKPVTKLFEYKVGGTLSHPHSEPLRFPKFLMFPFHPFTTLRQMFSPPEQK